MNDENMTVKKAAAEQWFQKLQADLIARFEALEDAAAPALYAGNSGRFERTTWKRGNGSEDLGGGTMALLKGRLFEKAGIHTSTVFGRFSEEFRKQIPGADSNGGEFWASGISLIAHPANPRIPAVHMNTRMIATSKSWFGGGADLTPLLGYQRDPYFEDSLDFHAALKHACDGHDKAFYPKFRDECDIYFHLAHRDEPRGTGGIFYDRHDTGNWEEDFAFTQTVGRAFADIYPSLVTRRFGERWSEDEREEQLVQRGRYVEFNLLYDRGTTFGLKTGGNVKSILSSMPPVVKWP